MMLNHYAIFIILLGISCQRALGTICPDKTSLCPFPDTCCAMRDGRYGCCPYANGTCCSDEIHCCPEGTTCNVRMGSCVGQGLSIPFPWMVQIFDQKVVLEGVKVEEETHEEQALPSNDVESVKCPDGYECNTGETCCRQEKGNYLCCPYSGASCCSDFIHCCPYGYRCSADSTHCQRGNAFDIFMPEIKPAFNQQTKELESVPAVEDPTILHTSTCSSPQCDSWFGPGQVCCGDGFGIFNWCCPPSTNCETGFDITKCKLTPASESQLDLNKFNIFDVPSPNDITKKMDSPMMTSSEMDSPVVCPNKKSACRPGQTCCALDKEEYGCCPLPEATCCPDMKSCCPNSYMCVPNGCSPMPALAFLTQRSGFIRREPVTYKDLPSLI